MYKFQKVVAAILVVLFMISCHKNPCTQTVVFHPTLVETGSMTRTTAEEHNEIKALIKSTYNTSFAVNLYTDPEENQFIRMEFGKTYTVPVGTWNVTGYNSTLITEDAVPTVSYRLTRSPHFYVNEDVTIQYGISNYELPVQIRAVGIIYKLDEVKEIQYQSSTSGSYIKVNPVITNDNYGLFFICGYFQGTETVTLKTIPVTGAYEETEFYFAFEEVNQPTGIYCPLSSGKYYILHPESVTVLDGISVSLDIPEWECGLE